MTHTYGPVWRGHMTQYCKTGLNSGSLTAAKVATNESSPSLDYALEIIPIIPYIGVVFPFLRSLWLLCYHFYFLMSLNETLTFLSLSNPVLQKGSS